jgi:hypothetical protein
MPLFRLSFFPAFLACAVPADFCSHGRTLRLYDLDHYSTGTDTKAGGDD